VQRVSYLVVNSGDALLAMRLTPSTTDADRPAHPVYGAVGVRAEAPPLSSSGPMAGEWVRHHQSPPPSFTRSHRLFFCFFSGCYSSSWYNQVIY